VYVLGNKNTAYIYELGADRRIYVKTILGRVSKEEEIF
jgi:hypothetical protein